MKIKSLLFVVLIPLLFTGCVKKESLKQNENKNDNIATQEEIGFVFFDEKVKAFNDVYKKALFSTGKEQIEEAKKSTTASFKLWSEIVTEFKDSKPESYKNTNDWELKLNEILDLEQKSLDLVLKDNFLEAHEELEMVRKKLRELRQENGIKNISDDMLNFHDIMEEVDVSENKAQALSYLDSLKTSLNDLKKYDQGEEYLNMLNDISTIITAIEVSTDDTFNDQKSKLKPTFIKMYLKFG